MNRVFLDYDSSIGWLWRIGPLWDDLLDLVRMEAKRLGKIFLLGDIAVIMRSDNGWHLRFPKARLTQEQMETVMIASKSHRGPRVLQLHHKRLYSARLQEAAEKFA